MEGGSDTCLLQDAWRDDCGTHLLIASLRRVVARRGVCAAVRREFADIFGPDGEEALGVFRGFFEALGRAA